MLAPPPYWGLKFASFFIFYRLTYSNMIELVFLFKFYSVNSGEHYDKVVCEQQLPILV
jgi:hypothetical protein